MRPMADIARDVTECADEWDAAARLLGNVRADEIAALARQYLAAHGDGFASAREQAAQIADPYHRSVSGRGCPHLCGTCSDRRNISDKIRALVVYDGPR